MQHDEWLEKEIGRILAAPAAPIIPPPKRVPHPEYGYLKDQCPVCKQLCLVRGGYRHHYIKVHDASQSRQKAKAIIVAVRKYDARMAKK